MQKPHTDFTPIERLMMSDVANLAMQEATRIGLFDTLDPAPRTAREVAEAFGFETDKTEALLDLLAAHGLLDKNGEGYANTPMAAEYLCTGSPFFMGQGIRHSRAFVEPMAGKVEALLRGEAQQRTEIDHGWSLPDMLESTEQYARIGPVQNVAEHVAGLPGFDDMRLMCDMGGNHGAFSVALVDRNPNLRSEIADLPEVAAAANARLAERGYADTVSAFACNLRTTPLEPGRYDLVLASHILYGFMNDLEGLLSMIHDALRPQGWFVSHHLTRNGGKPADITAATEYITRMGGYSTHHIEGERLEKALLNAGFLTVLARKRDTPQTGLVVAARRA